MSIAIMTEVWQCGRYDGARLLLLLAMADFAQDDGSHIYPSVETLAGKIRASVRTVQYHLRSLEDDGVIVIVQEATQHRPREYRIEVQNLHPWEGQGCNLRRPGVQSATPRGAIAVAPESLEPSEPSKKESSSNRSEDNPTPLVDEFTLWWQLYPRKVAKGAARKAYRAARKKTDPDTLSAGVQRYRGECAARDPTYIKHPASWLNGECWLDEGAPAPSPTPAAPRLGISDDLVARARATQAQVEAEYAAKRAAVMEAGP